MITFKTKAEAIKFQEWANQNSPMLPILPNQPIEQNGKWVFELKENEMQIMQEYYNKFTKK